MFSSAPSEITIKLWKLEIRHSYILSLQSSVCTWICILNPCMFQTGLQRAESGGRYESCLKDSFSVCQLDALPKRLLMNTHWTALCGQEKGKEEHHKPFISHVGQCWACKDVPMKEREGGCNHCICVSSPVSHSYCLCQGKDSLPTALAQSGQGRAAVTPEGMSASWGHEPQEWQSSASLTSWVYPGPCFQETSTEIQSNRQGLYFHLKLQ